MYNIWIGCRQLPHQGKKRGNDFSKLNFSTITFGEMENGLKWQWHVCGINNLYTCDAWHCARFISFRLLTRARDQHFHRHKQQPQHSPLCMCTLDAYYVPRNFKRIRKCGRANIRTHTHTVFNSMHVLYSTQFSLPVCDLFIMWYLIHMCFTLHATTGLTRVCMVKMKASALATQSQANQIVAFICKMKNCERKTTRKYTNWNRRLRQQ